MINSTEVNQFLQLNTLNNQQTEEVAKSLRRYLKTQGYSRADISNITVLSDHGLVMDLLGTDNYYPAANMRNEYRNDQCSSTDLAVIWV